MVSRLNSVTKPPRHRQDKGGEMAERSSAVALNGVDSLSLSVGSGSLLLFSLGFGRLGFFLCLYLKVT